MQHASKPYPMPDRRRQELRKRNPSRADEDLAARLPNPGEGFETRQGLPPRSALDLESGDGLTAPQDEIDFAVAFPPIKDLHLRTADAVDEVGADRRLDETSPELRGAACFGERARRDGRHQSGVEHLQLGTRSALLDALAGNLLKTGQQTGAGQELEATGASRRATAWRASVVLPTCRGPTSACRKRRGS